MNKNSCLNQIHLLILTNNINNNVIIKMKQLTELQNKLFPCYIFIYILAFRYIMVFYTTYNFLNNINSIW